LAVKNRRILQRRPWPIDRAIGAAARRRNLHPILCGIAASRFAGPAYGCPAPVGLVTRHCIPSLMQYAGWRISDCCDDRALVFNPVFP
jgi:hypothetical protein